MELFINLNNQRNLKRSKKTLIIFSGITLILSICTFVGLFFESTLLLWLYAFYFLIIAISLFFQSKGKHLIDMIGKSYFKIDDHCVESKLSIFSKKVLKYNWDEIEELKIKLFDIQVKINKHWKSIDLEKLSDDNLKSVKQIFKDFQANLESRQIVVS